MKPKKGKKGVVIEPASQSFEKSKLICNDVSEHLFTLISGVTQNHHSLKYVTFAVVVSTDLLITVVN